MSSFKAHGEQFTLMLCLLEDGTIMKQVTNSSHHPGAIFHQKARYQLALLTSSGELIEDSPAEFECGRHLDSGSHVVPPILPLHPRFEEVIRSHRGFQEVRKSDVAAASTEGDLVTSYPALSVEAPPIHLVMVLYAFEQLLDLRQFQDHEIVEDDEIDLLALAGDSSGDSEEGGLIDTCPTQHFVSPSRATSPVRGLRCRRRSLSISPMPSPGTPE